MATLNQLAARIANMINQPDNQDVLERAKDMLKNTFAKYIRQSSERHGVDDILTLSFIAEVDELNYSNVRKSENNIINKETLLGTVHKVPVPIRVFNDAPFLYVGSVNGDSYKYLSNISELKFMSNIYPIQQSICYTLENGRILLHKNKHKIIIDDRRPINEILIKAIWENPEDVLTMYEDIDGQDIELPYPQDIIENAILEVLKINFNLIPKDISIKTNDDSVINKSSN